MILAPGSFARVGAILVIAVVLQISGVAQVGLLGAAPDLVPLAVAAVAFFGGSIPGAVTGFAAGLLLDLSLGSTAGSSSLVLTAVGYGAGRYREVNQPSHGLAPVAFALLATAAYLVGSAAVSFMLGIEAPISLLVLRDILVTALLNALLALPAFWLLRRVLRGSLVSDPLARRRRPRTREPGPIGLRGLEV